MKAGGVEDITTLGPYSGFGRVCQPEDVAAVVVFCCSEASGYMTGQRIEVDGGGPKAPPLHRVVRAPATMPTPGDCNRRVVQSRGS